MNRARVRFAKKKRSGNVSRAEGFTSVVGYHDYLLLTLGVDAEWTRKRKGDQEPVQRVFDEVDEIAKNVRQTLEQGHQRAGHGPSKASAWANLYEPVHSLPVGHADTLSYLLLDDFDPIHEIAARCSTTLEEIGVGLCPKIGPLVAEGDNSTVAPRPMSFLEPHEMIALCRGPKRPPLQMFARFKLNGWVTLGFGLMFQAALFRAIIREARQAMQVLKTEAGGSGKKQLNVFGIEAADIDNTKFCLLDMQGQEELAIWCVTNNYSIPMAALSRLYALTIGDVFAADSTGTLKSCLREKSTEWFHLVGEFLRDMEPAPECKAFRKPEDLEPDHVFRWTRSTLGVSYEAFKSPDTVKGYVHAVTVLQTATGHERNVEKTLDEIGEKLRKDWQKKELSDIPEGTKFHLHAMGQGDLLLHHHGFKIRDRELLVPTAWFFKQVDDCVQAFMNAAATLGRRDLVGLASVAGIPVPELKRKEGDEDYLLPMIRMGHSSPMETVLAALRWRIAPDGRRINRPRASIAKGRKLATGSQGLSLAAIKERLQCYGLPLSLIHSIEFLFQSYATLLANPFVYDAVLDLYDAFATLHRTLTEVLYSGTKNDGRRRYQWPRRLHHTKVDEIAQFVSTLHRALEHRLYRAYPEELQRDMDIDFRGGLNQLLFAADAVLKCGVGVLRNDMFGHCNERRDTVGVVMRVAFQPGIWAIKLHLEPEQRAPRSSAKGPPSTRLAVIATDVPHVHNVPAYLDFLHESFHLIYDELRSPSSERDPHKEPKPFDFLPTVVPGSLLDDRLSEIFVNTLLAMFVCRDEPETLAKHFIVQYSASSWPGSANEAQTIRHFVEIVATAFITNHTLRVASSGGSDWWIAADSGSLAKQLRAELKEPGKVSKEFCAFLRKTAGPLFSDWEEYWINTSKSKAVWEFTDGVFRDYYRAVRPFLPQLLRASQRIFVNYVEKVQNRRGHGVNFQKWSKWEKSTDDYIRRHGQFGRPLALGLWCRDVKCPNEAMFVVARYLRHTIRVRLNRLVRSSKTMIHLPSLDEAGVPRFRDGVKYSPFLIRPGANSFSCYDPKARRTRLLGHIGALKTFWDVSTLLRARRFGEMLKRNLSVEETSRRRRKIGVGRRTGQVVSS